MKKGKSFVPYHYVGGTPALGLNKLIATTDGSDQRICETCVNRCLIGIPNMTDCCNQNAKKAFGAGEKVVMPKKLHGQHVGNFCPFFEKSQSASSITMNSYASTMTNSLDVPEAVIQEKPKAMFIATKNGRYYYPSDYKLPGNVNQEKIRRFDSVEEAINAGYVPRF